MFKLPWILTLAGAVPFVGLSVLLAIAPEGIDLGLIQYGFVTYGAVILVFLSGIHWGLGVAFGRHELSKPCRILFLWSNIIALSGWLALLADFILAIPLLAVGFLMQWVMDRSLYRVNHLPHWFMQLRNVVTPIVLASCLVAYVAIA